MELSFAERHTEQRTKKYTNTDLYHDQMHTLELFLERRAISKEQYEKSAHDLTEKMGMSTK